MSSHEEHESLTVAEFFEEYWVPIMFGGFFLMTMFMAPFFATATKSWVFIAVPTVIGVALLILILPMVCCKK